MLDRHQCFIRNGCLHLQGRVRLPCRCIHVTSHKTVILLHTSQNMSIKIFNKYKKGRNEGREEEGKDGRKNERKKAAVVQFIHTIWNASILLQLLRIYYFKLPVSDIKQNALQYTLKCPCAVLFICKTVHTYKSMHTNYIVILSHKQGCGCFNQ